MADAVIVDAVRTPIGRRHGALTSWHPVDLTAHADGRWAPTIARLQAAGPALQLTRARPGTVYRLRLR